MLEPGSRDYAWTLQPGVRSFTVSVTLSGLHGAPAAHLTNYHYTLAGGPAKVAYASQTTNIVWVFPGTACAPCLDGRDEADSLDELAGDWTLHLEWGASEAHYDLQVTVAY